MTSIVLLLFRFAVSYVSMASPGSQLPEHSQSNHFPHTSYFLLRQHHARYQRYPLVLFLSPHVLLPANVTTTNCDVLATVPKTHHPDISPFPLRIRPMTVLITLQHGPVASSSLSSEFIRTALESTTLREVLRDAGTAEHVKRAIPAHRCARSFN